MKPESVRLLDELDNGDAIQVMLRDGRAWVGRYFGLCKHAGRHYLDLEERPGSGFLAVPTRKITTIARIAESAIPSFRPRG